MPIRGPTFPSFTLVLSSKRDSFALHDHYSTTRLGMPGPYFRSLEHAQDLMKTIDHRGRESVEFGDNFLLPDALEKDESDRMEFDGQSEREDIESTHDQANTGQHKGIAWLWRFILLTLRKHRGPKVDVQNVGTGI